MAAITIRKLEDSVREKLRVLAAQNGRSMEEEAREILRASVDQRTAKSRKTETGGDWVRAFRKKLAKLGYEELKLPKRERPRDPSRLFS